MLYTLAVDNWFFQVEGVASIVIKVEITIGGFDVECSGDVVVVYTYCIHKRNRCGGIFERKFDGVVEIFECKFDGVSKEIVK